MGNKVLEYLSSKEKNLYTQLDLLFEMYIDGTIENTLTSFKFYDIEIFAYCNKGAENSMQLSFKYYNLACVIDFFNKKYEYVIYAIGESFDQVKDSFIECTYEKEVSINSLIYLIYDKLKRHSNLKDNTQSMIKKKRYKMIANVCLAIPCAIIGGFSIYILLTKETIKLEPFFILIIIIPIILWLTFYIKSAKLK
ncbi:MAG: hypothetical protein Q7I99_04355 [Acholeplasmataceae bacterium]|nr:hypothetical protein [Acholeplasmataceae bacterium]